MMKIENDNNDNCSQEDDSCDEMKYGCDSK